MVSVHRKPGEFPAGMPPLHLHGKPVAGGCTSGPNTASKSKSLQPPSAAIPILEKAISQIESEDAG